MRAAQWSSGRRNAADALVMPTRLASGVPVLAVEGPLGAVDLRTCRMVLDDLLKSAPEVVAVDVNSAMCGNACLVVLALIRRYAARRGVRLVLTVSSRPLIARLRRARLADLYPVIREAPELYPDAPVPGDAA